MEGKRYFFKLEMEQLPDNIWMSVKCTDIVQQMKVGDKLEIVDRIEEMPELIFDKLRYTVKTIRNNFDRELTKKLAKKDEWFSPEEDEAWKDL